MKRLIPILLLGFSFFTLSSPTLANGERVLLYAIYYDTKISNETNEAVALINTHTQSVNLNGWQLSDDEKTATITTDYWLEPNHIVWFTEGAAKFKVEFGFAPDFEYRDDDDATIPNLSGGAMSLSNSGDEVILYRPDASVADAILYENGTLSDIPAGHWSGAGVFPYAVSRQISTNGQILVRRHENNIFIDTDTADDWVNSHTDPVEGRRAIYPGWLETVPDYFTNGYWRGFRTTENAPYVQILVAPDNLYTGLMEHIQAAQQSIKIVGLTFEHPQLAMALAEKNHAGVEITALLEGSPPGGTSEMQDWVCRHLATGQNGRTRPANTLDYDGQCWLMSNNYQGEGSGSGTRYRNYHAKFMLIDAGTPTQKVVVATENWDTYSLPEDDKSNGTQGNRGYAIVTTAADVVQYVQMLWEADFQPCVTVTATGFCTAGHYDIVPWQAPDDTPPWPYLALDNTTYQVQFPQPFVMPQSAVEFSILHAPEQTLAGEDGIIALIENSASSNGKLYVQQLYERTYWGSESTDSPVTAPNPRLEAYIEAARKGADVRILLNDLLIEINGALTRPTATATDNTATCDYVNAIAAIEHLTLECKVKRVTHDDIHAKLILAWDGTEGYTHLGSINGSEASHKTNRELALNMRSTEIYSYLETVFLSDWNAP